MKIENVKMLKNHMYQFDTVLNGIGLVTVNALVVKDAGSYYEPPHSETEIHAVTQNMVEIDVTESQFDTLEQLAEMAYNEAMSGDEPDFDSH